MAESRLVSDKIINLFFTITISRSSPISLIQYSIKNMIGGVSQQPPSIRMQNQCDEMINCVPSVTDFLKRRSGTSHIAKILSSLPDNAFIDFIIRGENETGLLIITNGTATVYRLDGTQIGSVYNAYFNCTSPKSDLKLMTINDYNFILNTAKSVTGSTSGSGISSQGSFIFIKQAAFNTTYRVIANNKGYTYKTPADASGGYVLSTEFIAKELARKIKQGVHSQRVQRRKCTKYGHTLSYSEEAPLPSAFLCGFPLDEDTLCWQPTTIFEYDYGDDTWTPSPDPTIANKVSCERCIIKIDAGVTVEVYDGMFGQYMYKFKDKTSTFTELPTIAPNKYILEITGSADTHIDNYYVQFLTNNGEAIGEGYWKETCKGGIEYALRSSDMPQAIVLGGGSVSFKAIYWANRKVGDDDTCPLPSFIDKRINDIFFYRNRLCLLTDDNICMSESGEFFNFFKTTATMLLDSDPIDVAVSATKVSRLRYGVPYAEGLFVYSDGTLFVAEHGDVLSTASISVRPLLQFDSFLASKPLVSDVNIFYATSRGANTQLREYIPNSSGDMYGYSNDITSHIPTYIPKGIRSVSVCIEESLLLLTADDGNLYVYKWQNGASGERVQSAWGRWEFSGNVLNAEVVNGVVYLVIKYTDGVYLEKLVLSERDGLLKDRRGSGAECDYLSRYVYSRQFLRQESSAPTITAGRMQLRTIALRYAEPTKFNLIIERAGRAAETRNGGTAPDESRFSVLSNAEHTDIVIQSTGHEPFRFVETRFEALFTARTRII